MAGALARWDAGLQVHGPEARGLRDMIGAHSEQACESSQGRV